MVVVVVHQTFVSNVDLHISSCRKDLNVKSSCNRKGVNVIYKTKVRQPSEAVDFERFSRRKKASLKNRNKFMQEDRQHMFF